MKKENFLRQSVGIDCGKDELVVCFSQLTESFEVKHRATRVFANTTGGIRQLLQWSKKLADSKKELVYVVEATEVYHEVMAHFLSENGCKVSVVLPNRARYFSKTLTVKTENDKVASKMLATLGLEKKLDAWQPPHPVFLQLKQLSRERTQLKIECNRTGNQLHALERSASGNDGSMARMKSRLRLLEKQIIEIELEIKQLVSDDDALAERIDKVCTVKGIGFLTAVTIIAETDGFNLIRNKKQLVSYAGYDVVQKISGTSVRGKARISGRGNKHIRKTLYWPAMVAVKFDAGLRAFYQRLEQKHGIKMKAYTAVQRKLLVLIYTLWKKNEAYNPEYFQESGKNIGQPQQVGVALSELDHVRS